MNGAPALFSPLPHSLEAEEALLGSLLLDSSALSLLGGQLSAEDFYLEVHQHIYLSIEEMHAAGSPIDTTTLFVHLRSGAR